MIMHKTFEVKNVLCPEDCRSAEAKVPEHLVGDYIKPLVTTLNNQVKVSAESAKVTKHDPFKSKYGKQLVSAAASLMAFQSLNFGNMGWSQM